MSGLTFLEQFEASNRWPTAPAKRRFQNLKRVNRGMEETHRLALTMRGVVDRSLDDLEGLQASDYSTYQIFEANDLAFKLIDLENIKTSRVGHVPRRGIMSPAYIRLCPSKSAHSRFYYWYFFAAYLNNIFNGMGGGVRQNLTPTDLLEFPVPLPDLPTQKAIAAFLDRETARIDQLIEKKQRLVELLSERIYAEQALLLCGRSSGDAAPIPDAPWLRPLPNDWNIRRLRSLVRISTGSRDTQDAIPDGRYPFYVRSPTVRQIDTYSYDEEAVLTSGDGAGVGAVFHLVKGKFELHQRMYAFTEFKNVEPRFFYLQLRAFFCNQMQRWSAKSTVDSVRMPFLKSMPLALPPITKQVQIVSVITDREAGQKKIIEKTECSIARLKEYRSALITAAVTGQIDVRNNLQP